jgi:phosphatidylglycerophosphatase A
LSTPTDQLKTACITVLGSGFAPLASGSWGSLAAVILWAPLWLLPAAWGGPRWAVEISTLAGILLASWLSVAWGQWAIRRFASKDPKPFVLDEFAGQWVALLWLPISLHADWTTLAWVVGGQFLLFRLFDIIKPPPARQVEKLPDGWGILIDDLFAGLFANIAGQLVWRFTTAATTLGLTMH